MKLVARAAVSKDLTGAGGSASKAFTWLQIDMLLLATQRSVRVCRISFSQCEPFHRAAGHGSWFPSE